MTLSLTTKTNKRLIFSEIKGPGIREHVEDVIFRLGGINLVWGSKGGVILPITLPSGLYLVERVGPPDTHLRLLLLLTHFIGLPGH